MAHELKFLPLSLPESVSTQHLAYFGREVVGFNPDNFSEKDFQEIEDALYRHDMLLFRNIDLTPDAQFRLAKAFDPTAETYGLGHNSPSKDSILFQYIKQRLPKYPQVQVIGHGTVRDHEGIREITLKHGRHPEFHKHPLSEDEEASGFTRFFRWHFDAALYDLDVPNVTTLYGLKVPIGPTQTVRYDDGTGDQLEVPLGTTAMISGKIMFEILPPEMKSLVVRARVKYPPHPFDWLKNVRATSNGIAICSEGKETPLDNLPAWDENKIKTYPMSFKITQRALFM